MNIIEKILKAIFGTTCKRCKERNPLGAIFCTKCGIKLHISMSKVMVHDGCGGWLYYVEYNCGAQLKCAKCGENAEAYFGMGKQLLYHYEWHSTEAVNKFYDD